MRPFKMRQIITWKCQFCGGKNKLVGDLEISGVKRGESIKCCNCGHIDNFVDHNLDYRYIAENIVDYTNRRCVQEKYCEFKDCDLYGTCKSYREKPGKNDKNCSNKNPNSSELSLKPIDRPRFL